MKYKPGKIYHFKYDIYVHISLEETEQSLVKWQSTSEHTFVLVGGDEPLLFLKTVESTKDKKYLIVSLLYKDKIIYVPIRKERHRSPSLISSAQ